MHVRAYLGVIHDFKESQHVGMVQLLHDGNFPLHFFLSLRRAPAPAPSELVLLQAALNHFHCVQGVSVTVFCQTHLMDVVLIVRLKIKRKIHSMKWAWLRKICMYCTH